MPCQYAPGISVGHKNRALPGVKQNGVHGFRTQALDREELSASFISLEREHCFERAVAIAFQPNQKILNGAGFLSKKTGGTHTCFQLNSRSASQSRQIQQALLAELFQRQSGI